MSIDDFVLRPYEVYDVIFGAKNIAEKGVFLGSVKRRGGVIYKMLVRTQKNNPRDGVDTPRIYNFKNYELYDNLLFIRDPILHRKLNPSERVYCESVFDKRGI